MNAGNNFVVPADFMQRLAERLTQTLPGERAWRRFSPELSYGRHAGPAPHSARQAAVLVLFYQREGEWHLPLMMRPDHMVAHASQVSFPGGVTEGDETPELCAVREFEEELGATASEINMLDRLSPVYIYGTNFEVTPCVAFTQRALKFTPNPLEVAEVIELPLSRLFERNAFGFHVGERYGIKYRAPDMEYRGHRIWGATCLMLAELRTIVETAIEPASGEF